MSSLTVAFVTARHDPKIEWFLDSFGRQWTTDERCDIIIIDSHCEDRVWACNNLPVSVRLRISDPKPTIWQGPHRITKEDWWAKSNALNTAICLCETEWIAFVDDRSVLCPGWLDCVRDAMRGNYAVCGSYEKHYNLKVENGIIVDEGVTAGIDTRLEEWRGEKPYRVKDWYGGHGALPLEWCLAVNGFAENLCDGLSSEDSVFGITLHNSGFPIYYDSRMKIIEDRTPGQIDGALKRADKGVSPRDKSHAIISIIQDKTSSQNSFDIRNLRARVLNGEPLDSIPSSASHFDWYDNEPIADMI